MEEVVDCTTDYINFCMDVVVPVRTAPCYANNKPWITSHIKSLLNQKKKAFKDGDQQELRRVQRELRVQLREAKEQYRRKLEQKLQNNSMKEVWDGLKIITSCSSRQGATIEGDVSRVNRLNNFFNRFDNPIPLSPLITMPPTPSSALSLPLRADTCTKETPSPPAITAAQVCGELRRLHPSKAAGPDGVSPRLLKACTSELGDPHPAELNDFRPVTLT
ncbi:uncharacterized protein LOC126387436 [Epinephelus moara]|uniref:uncharacterized protein LOC126387436 n=1 Tax=Epinephelus moara TaxID=300413 RepID=UPI00214E0CED|nr:uncharacterized protein LOC126387436 [Epinephelus moara]